MLEEGGSRRSGSDFRPFFPFFLNGGTEEGLQAFDIGSGNGAVGGDSQGLFIDAEAEPEKLGKEQYRQQFFSGATDLQVFLGSVELEVAIGADRGNKVGTGGLGAGDLFFQQLMGKIIVQTRQSCPATLELAAPVEAGDAGGLEQFLGDSRDEGIVKLGNFPRP